MKELGDKLKSEPAQTPIQEVRPVGESGPAAALNPEKTVPAKNEAHINFWTDEALVDRMKIYAVKSRKTIKQICTEALEQYLPKDK